MINTRYFFLLSMIIILHAHTAWGQITIMEKPKAQGLIVQKYDSLTNFEEKYYGQNNPNYYTLSYHHLIGQTILYCGSDFKNCRYGEYYIITSIITKHNIPYFVLTNRKTRQRIEVTGISYNSQFVVQGHYKKLKQLYIGKRFLYKLNDWSSSHYYDVKSGNYAEIDDGSIWVCTDIQVEDRRERSRFNKYSPLLMIFTSNNNKKIYCYYEDFYDMEDISGNGLSDENVKEQYFVSKFGEKYSSAILNGRLEIGMTKKMVISLFGNQTPNSKTTSIRMTNGKTMKEEKWIYKELVNSLDGKPMILTLTFDKDEKLSFWNIQ